MHTESKLGVAREARLVALGLAAALVVVGLIGLVEKGPPTTAIPIGPSPLSPLSYGTLSFYETSRRAYRTLILLKPEDILGTLSDKCVYVVVSPTIPVRREEAENLLKPLKSGCGTVSVLVADEETSSNGLLEALNTTIRVVGNRVAVVTNTQTLSYYPTATIRLRERTHSLTLDLASEVVGGKIAGYVEGLVATSLLPSGESDGNLSSVPAVTHQRVPIASEEVVNGVHVFVLGDGSIFLNQVLNSVDTRYREFVADILNYLCDYGRDCTVLFDAHHYRVADPFYLISHGAPLNTMAVSLLDVLYLSMAIVFTMAHPAVWLPPVLKTADTYFMLILATPLTYILIPPVAYYVSRFLIQVESSVRDRPVSEQLEKDLYLAADLRKSVLGGSVKLGSKDFVNLFNLVSLITSATLGVELSDESFPRVLGKYVGEDNAVRYWRSMNRLHRRALRRSIWPPIVLWKRTVVRFLSESELVLNSLGESLGRLTEAEYIMVSGGRVGGPS